MSYFFNNAIIGNSRILATLNEEGRMLRIFWPYIDFSQQIDKMFLGVYFSDTSNTMHWLHDEQWEYNQYYIQNSNILKTVINSNIFNIKIILTDFVSIDNDIIVRNISIENISNYIKDINLCVYCSGVNNDIYQSSSLFDFKSDSIVLCKHSNYMFISSDQECLQFQLTDSPFDACERLFLYGADDYSNIPEGAMFWNVGKLNPGEETSQNIYMVFGEDLNTTRDLCSNIKSYSFNKLFNNTKKYWESFLHNVKKIDIGYRNIDELYKRSILILKLMSDESGGIIASAELDEQRQKSGGYGFCWPRDSAFITTALDKCGLTQESKNFYEWAKKSQDSQGFWHQRYYVNGNIAPSWGLQLDETGSIIWGIWHHFVTTKDKKFLQNMWTSIYTAAEYLIKNIDKNTGLPVPTYGIWEEKIAQHTYTSAAVCGGLFSAHKIATELGQKDVKDRWYKQSNNIKSSIQQNLYSNELKRFIKGINVKLNPWENAQETKDIVVNKKGYWINFSKQDVTIDSSLIGLVEPYGIFEKNCSMITNTIKTIEKSLYCEQTGGIKRYENDGYIGGNPWIVNTLWLAIYYIRIKEYDLAKKLLFWASEHTTKLGLLPEQIDKDTGEPAWVIPLTWSHAMFIHVLIDLKNNNQI